MTHTGHATSLALPVLAGLLAAPALAQAPASKPAAPKPAAASLVQQPWTGDLDGMIKRRRIRVLVPYNKTHYFIERGVQRGLAYVPQGRIVFQQMTVQENLEMGAFTVADHARVQASMERVYTLFPRLGERRTQKAGTMSGGEQQMLAIGRALMIEPRALLLDEPSLGLSPLFVDLIFDKIAELRAEGMTLLMVEQNAARALELSDRGYVLELGRNRFEGTGQELLADPRVRQLYLGG